MLHVRRDLMLRLFITISIGVSSYVGDRILKQENNPAMRAVFDNFTHAVVGGLTWTLIVLLSRKSIVPNLFSIVLCLLLSSFVDVDHFIAARSWKLSDATHLDKRPFLHCTTIPIATWLILTLSSKIFHWLYVEYYAWIILTSFLSHHIRDATRRGLWFCPVGSTEPIPYHLYICTSMGLPYILYWLMPVRLIELFNAATINVV